MKVKSSPVVPCDLLMIHQGSLKTQVSAFTRRMEDILWDFGTKIASTESFSFKVLRSIWKQYSPLAHRWVTLILHYQLLLCYFTSACLDGPVWTWVWLIWLPFQKFSIVLKSFHLMCPWPHPLKGNWKPVFYGLQSLLCNPSTLFGEGHMVVYCHYKQKL